MRWGGVDVEDNKYVIVEKNILSAVVKCLAYHYERCLRQPLIESSVPPLLCDNRHIKFCHSLLTQFMKKSFILIGRYMKVEWEAPTAYPPPILLSLNRFLLKLLYIYFFS